MHAVGESDECVVPAKCPNKGAPEYTGSFGGGHGGKAFGQEEPATTTRTGHCTGLSVSQGTRKGAGQKVFPAIHSRQEPYALKCARTDLCGGQGAIPVPTATKAKTNLAADLR